MAKTAIGLISTVYEFADEHLDLDLSANPTYGISRLHKVTREHESWPDYVIEAFDKAAPPNLVLARQLAFYTGQRRSDLIKMRWTQFDGKFIHGICPQKTDERLTVPATRNCARRSRWWNRNHHRQQLRQAVLFKGLDPRLLRRAESARYQRVFNS